MKRDKPLDRPRFAKLVPQGPRTTPRQLTRFGFSGHQTFPFRYGWLKKGVEQVQKNPRVFSQEDAVSVLGVGKNMVDSIRHWGLATGLLEEDHRSQFRPSYLGEKLLQAWDPFLEDTGSLWLLHWRLVSNPARAALWNIAFSHFPRADFSKPELLDFVVALAQRLNLKANPRTIARDIDCLVRMYAVPPEGGAMVVEDSFSCPLVELGLLQLVRGSDTYRFTIGPKRDLPDLVFAFTLFDYVTVHRGEQCTIPLQELMYGISSPGQAFKLDEGSVEDFLERVRSLTGGSVEFDATAGLPQAYVRELLRPEDFLAAYYEERA